MQTHAFGPERIPVARVGQGTWQMRDAAASEAALRRGLDLGMTHVDTAEMYGDAELVIARAIAGRRDDVFLVSKVLPQNASRAGTIEACERSLKRLGTDRLDGYLLHWRGRHPLAETIAAFEALKADGKILRWGVSNFDVDDLEEARAIAGDGQIACNQVLYHLKERAIEHAVLPWCEANGVALVGYSPFGDGDFPDAASAHGKALGEVADRHGATPRQVALAFLTRRPSLFAIPKASTLEHVEANAAAGDIDLSAEDVAALEAAFPLGRKPAGLPMV